MTRLPTSGAPTPPRTPQQQHQGSGLTGRDVMRIFLRRKWLIILSVVIFSAIAFVVTLLWATYAPMYTATATLAVEMPRNTILGGSTPYTNEDQINRTIQEHIEMFKQDRILTTAVQNQSAIRQSVLFRRLNPTQVTDELAKMISAVPVPNTQYFKINMTCVARTEKEREDMAEIVMAVANTYIDETNATSSHNTRRDINALTTKRQDLQTNLGRLTDRIKNLQSDGTLLEERPVKQLQAQTVMQQITKLEFQEQQLRAAQDAMQTMTPQQMASLPQVLYNVESDPSLRSLRLAMLDTSTKLASARERLGDRHPTVIRLKDQLKSLKDQIAEDEQNIIRDQVSQLKESNQKDIESIVLQKTELLKQYSDLNIEIKSISKRLEEIASAQNTKDDIEDQIKRIDSRLLDLQLIQQDKESVRLMIRASIPKERSMPKWIVMMPLGVLIGLVVGIGGAFLLEFIDTSIKSPSDLARRVGLPILGIVPHVDDIEDDIPDLHRAFLDQPDSLISEAFRHIRTGLLFSGPADRHRTLLVSSALPQDGRTTVAMNLAAAIASDGHKVLVVDANFRQPTIDKLFPECGISGLSNCLVGQSDWHNAVHKVDGTLSVMGAGPLPPSPAELLGSDIMKKFIADVSAEYDQVIFDGAPALVVTDGAVLGGLVDGVVLVVRAGANTHGLVLRMRDTFVRSGAHIVGVVLEAIRVTAGGYLRKNYETYYEYRQANGDKAAKPGEPQKT